MATDISTGLPMLDLAAGSTITVTTGQALALVTQLNVYTFNPATGRVDDIKLLPPLLAHQQNA